MSKLLEDRIEPLGPWILGRFVPRPAGSGLQLPDGVSETDRPPKLVVLKVGPGCEKKEVKPGVQIIMSPYMPIVIDQRYGYERSDGTKLFLYPSDQIVAVVEAEEVSLDNVVPGDFGGDLDGSGSGVH